MSSFPDVLSAELTYRSSGSNNKPTFTVPAEYAFAVVQVCFTHDFGGVEGLIITTSHGIFTFDGSSSSTTGGQHLKDFPILNLIIKGGESFSIISHGLAGMSTYSTQSRAKVTALCHKKPS